MSKKQELESVLGVGEHVIGAVVCWSLCGYSVERKKFEDAMDFAWPEGDAGYAIPIVPKPKAALGLAVSRQRASSVPLFFRPMRKSGGFALVLESEIEGKVVHNHVASVVATESCLQWFDFDIPDYGPNNVCLIENGIAKAKADLECEWRERREVIGSCELSKFLSVLINGTSRKPMIGAFSLRDRTGGVYFVPASTLPHLRRIRDAINGLSSGCAITILTVSGTSDNLVQAAEDARKSLLGHLALLREDASEFIARANAGDVRLERKSLDARVAQFGNLKSRVELFSEILGGMRGELLNQLDMARESVTSELEAMLRG